MKIALDLTQIPVKKTGAGIYARHLVKEIATTDLIDKGMEFYFFAQDDDVEWQEIITGNPACRLININSGRFRNLFLRVLFEQLILPRQCRKLNIDLIYSFHYTIPLFTGIKRAVIFHDMTFYLFPHLHQFIRRFYFKMLIPLALKKSDCITTVSQSTKNDILKRFKKIDPAKIAVIPLGVEPVSSGPAPGASDEILKGIGLRSRQYFLFVGTLEPRKNITGIIDAYHHLTVTTQRAKDFKLVITGGKGWFYDSIFHKVKSYGLEGAVVFTGYVEDLIKHTLLEHAFMFIYPSFYEGFGLPVLEAMAHGIPSITGNISSLPEVAGDAALITDPHRWQDIAEAVDRLLVDKKLYQTLAEKGPERAGLFSWKRNAQTTLDLLTLIK